MSEGSGEFGPNQEQYDKGDARKISDKGFDKSIHSDAANLLKTYNTIMNTAESSPIGEILRSTEREIAKTELEKPTSVVQPFIDKANTEQRQDPTLKDLSPQEIDDALEQIEDHVNNGLEPAAREERRMENLLAEREVNRRISNMEKQFEEEDVFAESTKEEESPALPKFTEAFPFLKNLSEEATVMHDYDYLMMTQAIEEVIVRRRDEPESASFEDLNGIIDMEEQDLLKKKSEMEKEGTNPLNAKVLSVELTYIRNVKEALGIMMIGGKIYDTDARRMKLDEYVRTRYDQLEAGRDATEDPDKKALAEEALTIYETFRLKEYDYTPPKKKKRGK